MRRVIFIEVLFLVTVIAILSSVIVPKISNSMKTIQADYFIKTIYSELRFIQAASRVNAYRTDNIFGIDKLSNVISIDSFEQNIRVKFRGDTFRRYKMPSGFSFENDFFMFVTIDGIFHDNKAQSVTSNHIRLKKDRKYIKPFLVFDSVGRLRLADSIK